MVPLVPDPLTIRAGRHALLSNGATDPLISAAERVAQYGYYDSGEIAIDQKSQIGTGRDVKLEFLGVPIFYTPWITFPVGDQRKSGLLFPTIGSSSKTGTLVAVPYYWNLAPNRDATLMTRYYSSRGLRLDLKQYDRDTQVVGNINVALIFGLLQFVTTFALAWYYAHYSQTKLDPLARQLDAEYRKGGDA